MDRLYKPKKLSEVLSKYGFRFTKSLGQNFLIDGNIVRKIADAAEIDEEDNVIEIGPGVGTLTEELALRAKKVVAIEIDEKLRELHKETLALENVKVIYGDFLDIDLKVLTEKEFGDESFKVVANLPYYVTTPIIEKLVLSNTNLISITVMVQKEVAKRLSAGPGGKDYGSLSVFINYYTDCKYRFQVPRSVFMPKPNVDSAVLSLKMKDREEVDTDFLFKVVRAAFTTRRKTILNSLSNSKLNYTKDEIKKALELSGVDERRRAETLDLREFIVLSVNFKSVG
ncbi:MULTISPECIES: 16S rRNA (adenine(1518)-N(6)/adenine(1519)-N(6))-dimethyltransferase RsmA [Peptoniphilus]|uniref:16S rRNA (adenine(1518)-N(6)/adenine(1519)-N(6))- dimethyltransferase RsmA n=1 Tax=Peptoniphilus TaxID=162289 RepID=UPI000474C837|nr:MULTISPECIES: 16S rRNA (adenine(1518)-N(6)/adenine(1519)-N(6))-dimethyltransferase RsmA [Peptoniphilus]MDU1043580.1 16S rRNA (adenine(1518)-N(6)/adenine(1519)-N(6))-dimethyltransferase RsmA [Peptoniphilus rhinitidis]MDU1954591.1 16S rRNA (adenine(1518)-N(6)/adenine(1519)-N(6))-dimethyltransferase RsmA [Peptoniphilus lacydonensis]MDU2109127.1 16S rRNA (adenine(1518)-N(6)/adenine(1519)-N(6))-dimethyltransferase RsmA [Peptoniphilus lacydonensis]MDU2115366.1 16S rRNA (adenine(1518)-N(6)/adenine(